MEEQHIYHHYDNDGLRINMSIEKNSRGFNYSVTIVGGKSVDEAMATLKMAESYLKAEYSADEPNVKPVTKKGDDIPF